jgi:glycosidase
MKKIIRNIVLAFCLPSFITGCHFLEVEQLGKSDSLLSHYKRLIMLRQANPEIARGEYTAVDLPDSKVGGFVASLNGSSVLVLHNTTPNTKTVDLSALGLDYHELSAVVGREEASLDGTTLTIGGLTSVILR